MRAQIPRQNYNECWRTYHNILKIFYDFLHLIGSFRDLDFQAQTSEEKLKIVERAGRIVPNGKI